MAVFSDRRLGSLRYSRLGGLGGLRYVYCTAVAMPVRGSSER